MIKVTDRIKSFKNHSSRVDKYLHNRDCIVVKYGRHVFGREFVRGIAYQKARLAHSTVTNNYTSSVSTQVSIAIHKYLTQSTPGLSHT